MIKYFLIALYVVLQIENLYPQTRLTESFTDPESIFDWTIINKDNGIQTWQRSLSKFRTAPASITCRFESATLQNDDWIITKKLFVVAGDSLTFWHSIQSSAYPESLYVKVGTTNNPNSGGWTNLAVIYDQSTSWKYKKYSLSAYAGQQIFIAFVNRSKDAFSIYIDDITGPQIVRPDYDLALVSFYQFTGLSLQPLAQNYSNEKKRYERIIESESTGFRQSEINLTRYKANTLPENIELNNIYIRTVVRNFGTLTTNYNVYWSISGAVQPTVQGNNVQPQKKDSVTLLYSPPSRGTYLVNGSLSVGGDEYPLNNSAKFRMLVYPNAFSKTYYDRGDNIADAWMGFGNPFVNFKAGMRFTATEDIKLAGVDFLYQTEFASPGQIEVQVRGAGPNNNMPGPVIYNKIYNSSVYQTGAGDYVHFAFDENAPVILAGSDYWITIKLPTGIQFPCAVHNDDFISGRSYYQGISDTTMWFPLIIQSSERCWIMRAIHIPVPSSFPFTKTVNNSWNLISIPGAHPNNQSVDSWWRYRDKSAQVYTFDGYYIPVNDLTVGKGYWMKHQGQRIYNTGDEWPSTGILYVNNLPLQCSAGWNLIGPYQNATAVSSITTTPPNLIISQIFGFTVDNGFQSVSVLNPGSGYLVKLSSPGALNLAATSFTNKTNTNKNTVIESWTKIELTDKLNRNYVLYLTADDKPTDFYELPPVPFNDIFDVRFSSGKFVENSYGLKSFIFQGVEYPVKIRVENPSLVLFDESGNKLNLLNDSYNEYIIDNPLIRKVFIGGDLIPTEFSLEQNYPNPFNASTTIRWQSPVNSWQTLKVYDVLGNEVVTLVDEFRDAGSYEIDFNTRNTLDNKTLSSGVYLYKLTIGEFSLTKKMILLK